MKEYSLIVVHHIVKDKYKWLGAIDKPVIVAKEEMYSSSFKNIPFKLERIDDYSEFTALFIRVDILAKIVRSIRALFHKQEVE